MSVENGQYQKIQKFISETRQWLLIEELRIKYAVPGDVRIGVELSDPLWKTVRSSLKRIPSFYLRGLAEINFASKEWLQKKCASIDPEFFENTAPRGIFERRDEKGYITINLELYENDFEGLQKTLYHEIGHSLYLNLKAFALDTFQEWAIKDYETNPGTFEHNAYRDKPFWNSPEEIFCRAFSLWMLHAPDLSWVEFYRDKYFSTRK
jgi:hypothetical protein